MTGSCSAPSEGCDSRHGPHLPDLQVELQWRRTVLSTRWNASARFAARRPARWPRAIGALPPDRDHRARRHGRRLSRAPHPDGQAGGGESAAARACQRHRSGGALSSRGAIGLALGPRTHHPRQRFWPDRRRAAVLDHGASRRRKPSRGSPSGAAAVAPGSRHRPRCRAGPVARARTGCDSPRPQAGKHCAGASWQEPSVGQGSRLWSGQADLAHRTRGCRRRA